MLYFSSLTITALLAGTVAAQAKATSVSTIYQFPKGTWIENLCVRKNGNLLLARYDTAEILEINPLVPNSTPKSLKKFTDGANAITGCAETAPDVFHFIAATPVPKSVLGKKFALWTVDYSGGATEPKISRVVDNIPTAKSLNGLAPLGQNAVIASDTQGGVVFRIDTQTGASASVINASLGINGIRTRGNTVYFTNTIQGSFTKVSVDTTTGKPTGPAKVVAKAALGNLLGADDFALGRGEDEAFIINYLSSKLVKVSGKKVEAVAGISSKDIPSATSAQFGRVPGNEGTLYIVTSTGKIVAVKGLS
jgi:hypothetical protein